MSQSTLLLLSCQVIHVLTCFVVFAYIYGGSREEGLVGKGWFEGGMSIPFKQASHQGQRNHHTIGFVSCTIAWPAQLQWGLLRYMAGCSSVYPAVACCTAQAIEKECHLKLHRVEPVVVWPLSVITQLALIPSKRVQQLDCWQDAWQVVSQQLCYGPLVCQHSLDVMQDAYVGLACTVRLQATQHVLLQQ